MKLKIVSAYSKTELEESFNKFITDDIVVNYTETHIEEGPKTSYSIFVFYDMLGDVYPECSTIAERKCEKETLKEVSAFTQKINNFLK